MLLLSARVSKIGGTLFVIIIMVSFAPTVQRRERDQKLRGHIYALAFDVDRFVRINQPK